MRETTSHEEASCFDDFIRFRGRFRVLLQTVALHALPAAVHADFGLRQRRGDLLHTDHHDHDAGLDSAAKRADASHTGPGRLRALVESLKSDSRPPRFNVHRESAVAK
jgi:hypothetical protein